MPDVSWVSYTATSRESTSLSFDSLRAKSRPAWSYAARWGTTTVTAWPTCLSVLLNDATTSDTPVFCTQGADSEATSKMSIAGPFTTYCGRRLESLAKNAFWAGPLYARTDELQDFSSH